MSLRVGSKGPDVSYRGTEIGGNQRKKIGKKHYLGAEGYSATPASGRREDLLVSFSSHFPLPESFLENNGSGSGVPGNTLSPSSSSSSELCAKEMYTRHQDSVPLLCKVLPLEGCISPVPSFHPFEAPEDGTKGHVVSSLPSHPAFPGGNL